MSPKKYIKFIITGNICLISIVALLNFFIDPGVIYFNNFLNTIGTENHVLAIKKSNFGMVADGWNERKTKIEFAKNLDLNECVVIGSSQVMSISKVRENTEIMPHCDRMTNLGVSGAAFEDLVIFSYLVSKANKKVDTVYIGIPPWLFRYNKDPRWTQNSDVFHEAVKFFDLNDANTTENNSYIAMIAKNLLNLQYLLSSIDILKVQGLEGVLKGYGDKIDNLNASKHLVPKFKFNEGYKKAVTLPDGSHSYSSERIRSVRNFKDTGYKVLTENVVDMDTVDDFITIALALKNIGIDVAFIFTPYYHDVVENPEAATVKAMKQTINVNSKIFSKLGFPTYGSYNPSIVGCSRDQFFDFMHPKTACVNKIFDRKNAPLL